MSWCQVCIYIRVYLKFGRFGEARCYGSEKRLCVGYIAVECDHISTFCNESTHEAVFQECSKSVLYVLFQLHNLFPRRPSYNQIICNFFNISATSTTRKEIVSRIMLSHSIPWPIKMNLSLFNEAWGCKVVYKDRHNGSDSNSQQQECSNGSDSNQQQQECSDSNRRPVVNVQRDPVICSAALHRFRS